MRFSLRRERRLEIRSLPEARHTPLGPPPQYDGFHVHPLVWHPVRTRMTADRAPQGRVIGVEHVFDYLPAEPEFASQLAHNDVVWVPLYAGSIARPAIRVDEEIPACEANWCAIDRFGGMVKAVLLGNANGEIYYEANPKRKHEYAMRFIADHAARLMGTARPAFAPVFEMLIYDCFSAGGEMRDLLNNVNALVLSFAGCWWLFENLSARIPEDPPRTKLAAYISSMEAWSGVGLLRGLEAGSGQVLKSMGYRAGIMGYY